VGIVYGSDAASEPRVRVAFPFDADSHPPVVYPAAAVRGSGRAAEARAFLRFCRGERAQAILLEHGFEPADGVGP